ncbi:sarcosine oxidase subunit gamma [Roseovarius sp. D22-M7]|uniref:sarcosine oxidase subunit gamma n=1 Tax=Roseovarius sp. D22-M7 TaxID=3127116 RepID=UPI0030101F92
MPDPVTPLDGARYEGFATIAEAEPAGMITLRGDLGSDAVAQAVHAATGLEMPSLRQARFGAGTAALWMAPDEVLLICPHTEVGERLAAIETALAGQYFLAADVSDARCHLHVSGPGAREVLAKLCPVDLAPDAFTPGMVRRTRMAQIAAAFWLDAGGTFHVICFRSVADYAFGVLKTAARPGGEVGLYA